MNENDPKFESIVLQAQALGPRERADFVRKACGADETLLSRVMMVLQDEGSADWHDIEAEETAGVAVEPVEGQRLGPYRIVRKLGSGGMGDVYLAERADEEYNQVVAIKLVRAGAFTPQVQGRLRTERQILARLQHPNIARLLDGGRAPDGTPYLVMEYIDGEPIDAYCDRRRLTLAERIALVRTVCSAVHYAHQNLIVHRDLKPNNILITASGEVKLLDFGIAKLLDTRHSAHTLAMTHIDYRVMTPAHASPEQVRGDTITTASDVYVLGVLLYELLCGRKPFHLVGSRLTDMERIICEQEAALPSAMVDRTASESQQTLASIVATRSTTPTRLRKELRGDLDNIVMMAMRKNPSRRYNSAEQLSADLQRHLDGEPVIATSDRWIYRTRKFVARHTVAVSLSAAAIVTLIIFATITYIQARHIARERDVVAAERARAEQVSSFLVELFELSDPSRSRGNQVTARELLDIGARRVNVGLTDQPETRATLLGTIGRVYSSLGLYPDSVGLLEEALASRIAIHGPEHAEVANALVELGNVLCEQGKLDECDKRLNAAIDMQRKLEGPESIEIAPTLLAQAKLAQRRGTLDVAERYFNESLALYRRHGQERTTAAASAMNELAGLYTYRGDFAKAETLYRAALDIDRQALGQDHPQVAMHVHDIAVALQMQGKLPEAEPMYAESTQMLRRILGPTHPNTLDAMANYGRYLRRTGDLERAEQVLADVLANDRLARGATHPFVGHDLVSLANVRLDRGNAKAAEQDIRAALEIYREALPADHPYVASALAALGRAQLGQGNPSDAEQTLRRAIAMAEKSLQPDSAPIVVAKTVLGHALIAEGRRDEGMPLLRENYQALVTTQGEGAALARQTREKLGSGERD
ncbi:serine/threonine-protein kinase [Povalibacter uvarum]|uniref:Serine/threonine-protein kinase n=1 Tax=Povalibacter uvarum TaxID=732238 RepID=A0A841HRV8_9GAMM|nr:tetratricopeptide repeat protein [Povalibacter uvarum]MBB6095039.1 serine/threonine-protein kinase [Povalibacter uvarum]